MSLLLKLLLAHLIGDFFLQPSSWVKEKEKLALSSPKLYLHALLHGILVLLLLWDWQSALLALLVLLVHLFIDAVKLLFQKKKTRRYWFFIDQAAHFCALLLLSLWWEEQWVLPEVLFTGQSLVLYTAVLALTLPASVTIKTTISKWAPYTEEKENESLQSAGKYIGIMERLFVFIFVVIGQLPAVGFLLAAKSVFRFGDLRESKDRKLTEYILIGTLLSFGMALLLGLLTRHYLF